MRVLGIGNPFLDRTLHVDALPEGMKKGETAVTFEKEKVERLWKEACGTGDFNWSLGGSCANVVKTLACLVESASCALLGMVGKDKKDEIEAKLKANGVQSLLVEGKEDNGVVNCFVTPDAQRTMQTFFGASLELTNERILPQHFVDLAHVHLEGYLGYFNGVLESCTKTAQEKGATVSLDLSSVDVIANCGEQLSKCASKVDIIFGNIEEMKKFTGQTEVEQMFASFKKEQIVVITNGSQGGWFKEKDTSLITPFKATATDSVVDTTGAGDFFIAGFLAEYLGKKSIHQAINSATIAASYVIQLDGTELPPNKLKELKGRIASMSLERSH